MNKHMSSEKREQLLKCAELYYVHRYLKKDIAKELHISPAHVGRLLNEAQRLGLIQIEVRLADRHRSLEEALQRKFQLKFSRVVDTHREYDVLKKNLGEAAASILDEFNMQRNSVKVGIGGGGTLLAMIEALTEKPRTLEIYPLALFGRGPKIEFVASTFLAMYLLVKTRPLSIASVVSLPPLPNSVELSKHITELFKDLPSIRMIIENAKKVDLAFVGLGGITPADDIFREYASLGYSQQYFLDRHAVGGINYNYFNPQGEQIGKGLLTLSINDLKQMSNNELQTVVLVAAGVHKLEAIRVALRTRIVNSLITDQTVANELLR